MIVSLLYEKARRADSLHPAYTRVLKYCIVGNSYIQHCTHSYCTVVRRKSTSPPPRQDKRTIHTTARQLPRAPVWLVGDELIYTLPRTRTCKE